VKLGVGIATATVKSRQTAESVCNTPNSQSVIHQTVGTQVDKTGYDIYKRRFIYLNFAVGRPRLAKHVIFRSCNRSRGMVRLRTVSVHHLQICALTGTAL
jgi:hypothetical protein